MIMIAVVALSLVVLARGMNVTMLVIEEVNAGRTGPPYDYATTLTNLPDAPVLIDVMNFAEHDGNFTYSAVASAPCGWYVTGINRVPVNSKTYWEILAGKDLSPLNTGGRTSNYFPESGESVLFRLRTWDEYFTKKKVTIMLTEEVTAGLKRAHNYMIHVNNLEISATLIEVLNKAEADKNLTFVEPFPRPEEEWYILDGDDVMRPPVGVNCYVPVDGEIVLLKGSILKSEEPEHNARFDVKVVVFVLFLFSAIVLASLAKNRKPKNQYRLTR